MPSFLIRLLLFLSSYFPLSVIFAVQFCMKGHCWVGIAILAIGTLGLIGMVIYIAVARRLNTITLEVERISRRDGDAMSYIVSYILPFIALPSGNLADVLSLVVFLLVLGVLYINSGMMHINPMLNLAGWHVYEVTMKNGETAAFLSRRHIHKDKKVSVFRMDDNIYLEAKS